MTGELGKTEDSKEAMRAFVEKRARVPGTLSRVAGEQHAPRPRDLPSLDRLLGTASALALCARHGAAW